MIIAEITLPCPRRGAAFLKWLSPTISSLGKRESRVPALEMRISPSYTVGRKGGDTHWVWPFTLVMVTQHRPGLRSLWDHFDLSLWTVRFPFMWKSVESTQRTTPSSPSGLFDFAAIHASFTGVCGMITPFAHFQRARRTFLTLCWTASFNRIIIEGKPWFASS